MKLTVHLITEDIIKLGEVASTSEDRGVTQSNGERLAIQHRVRSPFPMGAGEGEGKLPAAPLMEFPHIILSGVPSITPPTPSSIDPKTVASL